MYRYADPKRTRSPVGQTENAGEQKDGECRGQILVHKSEYGRYNQDACRQTDFAGEIGEEDSTEKEFFAKWNQRDGGYGEPRFYPEFTMNNLLNNILIIEGGMKIIFKKK